MSKLIVKILISFFVIFMVFFVYIGSTNFVVTPKLVEKEYKIEKNYYFFCDFLNFLWKDIKI